MVGSRMFGVLVDGVKTNILAPFADMLNHKLPKQTAWNYVQAESGFAIESLTEIPQGAEVFDSYGRKCNSRYLLNYGFVIPDNP
jgi:histone-lysine N-methyltransferase SETD3